MPDAFDMSGRPVLILGMHRSGTSCLAGCLEEAGLWLGNVNHEARFNRKGNKENRAIMDLHDRVLAQAGHAWDNPPGSPLIWPGELLSDLAALLADYPQDRSWGVKDPRTVLLMDGWCRLVEPALVGTFRHPLETVASLQRRALAWGQPMTHEQALMLWRIYNEHMLAVWRQNPFPVVQYFSQDYSQLIGRLCYIRGLEVPDRFSFLEAGLRHEQAEAPVPERVRDTWQSLLDLAAWSREYLS